MGWQTKRFAKIADEDMDQLAEVFQDVNRMVGQQGEQIDSAAGNVQVAEDNSAAGKQSLVKGAQYMSAYRKKILIIGELCSVPLCVRRLHDSR